MSLASRKFSRSVRITLIGLLSTFIESLAHCAVFIFSLARGQVGRWKDVSEVDITFALHIHLSSPVPTHSIACMCHVRVLENPLS
jgi:hypothetical protein